jgi:hypothetical protein
MITGRAWRISRRSNAFDNDHIEEGSVTPRLSSPAVLCGTNKCFGFFPGRELNQRQAVWCPGPFKGYYSAAPDEEPTAVRLDRSGRQSLVLIEFFRIGDADVGNDVRSCQLNRSMQHLSIH